MTNVMNNKANLASVILRWFLALLVIVVASMLLPTAARAAGYEWKHFGVDPYAASRASAMKTRESAFKRLGLPSDVVTLLMEATKKPGEKIRLVNGDHLSAMLSKGGTIHRDVVISFIKPPISGKMEYAAPAEKWQVSWYGQTYTVILPEICNNWSDILPEPSLVRAAPPVNDDGCVEIHFFTKPGDTVVRFALLGPASVAWGACFGVVGEADFTSLPEDSCQTTHCNLSRNAPIVGQSIRFVGSYTPVPGEHVLRLPALFAKEKSPYVMSLYLVRGKDEYPGFPQKASFAESYQYGESREAWIANHSDGIGVRWFDYQQTASGVKVATVYYTEAEIPLGAAQLYWPFGRWECCNKQFENKQ